MKCPLIAIVFSEAENPHPLLDADCLKEECAWWDKLPGRCSLLQAVIALESIRYELTAIAQELSRK